MGGTFSLNDELDERPLRYSVDELIHHAAELLAEQGGSAVHDAVPCSIVDFYIERRLVDEAAQDGSGRYFTRRHLLQLMAVQVLRGLELSLEQIGELVREVDDKNLKLLVDEPEEVAKKANVMRNWLSVIARGRYKRSSGDTQATPTSAQKLVLEVAPPPTPIQPARAPLVPNDNRDGQAMRTVMGNAKISDAHAPSPRLNLPTNRPYAPAAAAQSGGRGHRTSRQPSLDMLSSETRPGRVARSTRRVESATWRRHILADGIELHLDAAHDRSHLDKIAVNTLLAQIRALLESE